jgi:hypothetical protein
MLTRECGSGRLIGGSRLLRDEGNDGNSGRGMEVGLGRCPGRERQRMDRWVHSGWVTGEGERGTWQRWTSRGRGAQTDGCGPTSACVYGGTTTRHY